MIKAVLFDFGGVFVPDLDLGRLKESISYTRLIKSKREIERVAARYERGSINFERFCEELSILVEKDISGLLRKVLIEEYPERANLNQDMVELVKRLKKMGYKIGLISNMVEEHMEINRKKGNFELFRPTILSCMVGYRKPEREIYKIAIEETKENPGEILYVDNKHRDVIAARECGIEGLLYKNPKQISENIDGVLKSDLSLFNLVFEQ